MTDLHASNADRPSQPIVGRGPRCERRGVWRRGRALRRGLVAATLGLATVGALVAVSGCNQTHVRATRDPDADFTAYQTYAWADRRPSGVPAIDDDVALHNAIRNAVDAQMSRLEFRRAEPGQAGIEGEASEPDLVLTYHLAAEARLESTAIENYTYSSRGRKGRPAVIGRPYTQERRYVRGTLVLDIVDVRAHRVVWRGWAQADIDDYLDEPDKVQARVEAVIERLLLRFPAAPDEYDPDHPDPRF